MLHLTKFVRRALSHQAHTPIGFIGLGNMGLPMAQNLANAGYLLTCFDVNRENALRLSDSHPGISIATSAEQVAAATSIVISVLPNDQVLKAVSSEIMGHMGPGSLHVSCSTVSPDTSRELSRIYSDQQSRFVAAPIFARPDGMAAMQANFVMSGPPDALLEADSILKHTSAGRYAFGDDPGASNVVKLCGNFLIGCSIEAMAEALALAEKNGVDRVEAMQFYSSTFLNSVVYQGYGQRVSERDHRPGGFALQLGLKDMSLVQSTAKESSTPMPFLSVLVDRFLSEKAKGREHLDWSAIGLGVSEQCGIDVADAVASSSEGQAPTGATKSVSQK